MEKAQQSSLSPGTKRSRPVYRTPRKLFFSGAPTVTGSKRALAWCAGEYGDRTPDIPSAVPLLFSPWCERACFEKHALPGAAASRRAPPVAIDRRRGKRTSQKALRSAEVHGK